MVEINKNEEEILKQGERLFKYRKLFKRSLTVILIVIIAIGFILFEIFGSDAGKYFMIFSALIIFAISYAIQMYFWKCPKCNLNLPLDFESTKYMTHCPYCGVRLKE